MYTNNNAHFLVSNQVTSKRPISKRSAFQTTCPCQKDGVAVTVAQQTRLDWFYGRWLNVGTAYQTIIRRWTNIENRPTENAMDFDAPWARCVPRWRGAYFSRDWSNVRSFNCNKKAKPNLTYVKLQIYRPTSSMANCLFLSPMLKKSKLCYFLNRPVIIVASENRRTDYNSTQNL